MPAKGRGKGRRRRITGNVGGLDGACAVSLCASGSPSIWTSAEVLSAADAGGSLVLITVGELENPTAATVARVDPDHVSRLARRAIQMAQATGAEFVEIPRLGHGASSTPFIAHVVNFLWGETTPYVLRRACDHCCIFSGQPAAVRCRSTASTWSGLI